MEVTRSRREEAEMFLIREFVKKRVKRIPAKEILEKAEAEGICVRSLYGVRRSLNIKSVYLAKEGGRVWCLGLKFKES